MIAVLSDIHGNLEALTAVLADAEGQGVSAVYNLGDTLGYGPDPVACLALARRMTVVLMGNFDQTVVLDQGGFSDSPRPTVAWTHAQLSAADRAYVNGLPDAHRDAGGLFAHASPRNPLGDEIDPEDIHNPRKMARIGELSGPLCFVGHTHVPGVFEETGPGRWEYLHADECDRGVHPRPKAVGGRAVWIRFRLGLCRDET